MNVRYDQTPEQKHPYELLGQLRYYGFTLAPMGGGHDHLDRLRKERAAQDLLRF